eukprot:TRINITY_DN668_c0_g1_i1.p1 TRINITY_DN668_c0_g1~~TRINITY_DN668_c0_g1_i1.p1  ORF type:complete len:445 (+),score=97.26 TRINITY_DN668_c0_g1_i1:263-1597(+)
MGKVREAVVAWPNQNTQMQSTTTPSCTTTSKLENLLPSDDAIMKDLESELFAPIADVPNVSQYMSLLERDLVSSHSLNAVINLSSSEEQLICGPIQTQQTNSSISQRNFQPVPQISVYGTPASPLPSSCASSPPSTPLTSPPHSPAHINNAHGAPVDYPFKFITPQELQMAHSNLTPLSPQETFTMPQATPQTFMPQGTPHNYLPQHYTLSPLAPGGFLYGPTPGYPNSNIPFRHQFVPAQMQSFTTTVSPVGPAIACRQEKLDKYRQKRGKRNYTRAADPLKRERAQSRSRDEQGHFVVEKDTQIMSDLYDVKSQLVQSQEESKLLLSRLQRMEQEMALLKQKAEQATVSQEVMMKELAAQKNMNRVLIQENGILWTSVPSDQTFSTIRQNSPYVRPFEEKIDISTAVQDLTFTDSAYLEAARTQGEDVQKRWEDMTFIAGAC